MSSPFGVSHGLSAFCNSSTCTRQMRDQLLAASSAASRELVASPCAAPLGHQTGRGFVRRCNKPAAPLEASLAYSAIDFSRTLLSRLCSLSRTVNALQCTSLRTNSGHPYAWVAISQISARSFSARASFAILCRCVRSLSICSGC